MVRERGAEGHQVGERRHRHAARSALARHGLRAPAPLHGRARRRVPRLGLRERRQRLRQRGHRRRCAGARRRDPHTGAGLQDFDIWKPRHRRVAGKRRRVACVGSGLRRRPTAHIPWPRGRRPPAGGFRGVDPSLQVPRLLGQGEPRARRAAALHLHARARGAPARRDLDQPERRLPRARVRRRQVRRDLAPALHGHHHSLDARPVDGAAGQARDVDFRAVRALPPERRLERRAARAVRRHGHRHAGRVRAEPEERDPAPPGDHAGRHRAHRRPFRGQHLPGRAHAAADVLPAPRARVVALPHADPRPLPVRLGHASGRRRDGRFRTQCRNGDPREARLSDVVVIGADANGLVAADLLARAGHKVTVVQEEPTPARTMGWVPAQLQLSGLTVSCPDPWLRAPLEGGGVLELWRDIARSVESIRRMSAPDAEAWPRFCERMATLARLLERVYVEPPPSLVDLRFAFRLRRLGRQGLEDLMRLLPMPAAELLDDWFESGEELRASVVVSAADPRRTLIDLVEPGWLDPDLVRALGNVRSRGVAAKVALTLERAPDWKTLTLAPSLDYVERAYDDAKYGRVSARPWLDVIADGKNAEVHVQYAKPGADTVAALTSQLLKPYLPITDAQVLPLPVNWPDGQPHQAELALDQALWMRPLPELAGYRTPIKGLWLGGQAMHPAVPGVAGYNCARQILRNP